MDQVDRHFKAMISNPTVFIFLLKINLKRIIGKWRTSRLKSQMNSVLPRSAKEMPTSKTQDLT